MSVSLIGSLVTQKCVDGNTEPFITLSHIFVLSDLIWTSPRRKYLSWCETLVLTCQRKINHHSWDISHPAVFWEWSLQEEITVLSQTGAVSKRQWVNICLYCTGSLVILKEFGCLVQSKPFGNYCTAEALLCLHRSSIPLCVPCHRGQDKIICLKTNEGR